MRPRIVVTSTGSGPRPAASRVNDDDVMHLLKMMLKATGEKGVPQGGVISPLLSNLADRIVVVFKSATLPANAGDRIRNAGGRVVSSLAAG